MNGTKDEIQGIVNNLNAATLNDNTGKNYIPERSESTLYLITNSIYRYLLR